MHKRKRELTIYLAVVLLIALSLCPFIPPQAVSAEESCNWKLVSGIVNGADGHMGNRRQRRFYSWMGWHYPALRRFPLDPV